MVRLTHLFIAIPALLLTSILAFTTLRPIQVLPRIAVGPGFALTNQAGERLTNDDLRGHIVLYNFTYTHCVDPCPATGAAMRRIQETVRQAETGGIPIQLVTISFDPERDTSHRLRAYARELNADLKTWHFATGEPTMLKNVIGGGFGVYYQQLSAERFEFEPTFVLTDGWGILRAEYRTATPDLDTILRDIELIAAEAANSRGMARYAYEAAHLFVCYPR